MKLGLSGTLAKVGISSPLVPLFILSALVLGLIALTNIPREEEPQISVPMVDIFVTANGLKAQDAAELVTKPLENIVKGILGVEHVYSQTQDDRVNVTARFFVGTNEDEAIVRVHEEIQANLNRIPIGIPEPLVVGRGINDVAVVVLTLSPKQEAVERWGWGELYKLGEELQAELTSTTDIGFTYLVGGKPMQIRIEPQPEKLSLFGITLQQLVEKISNANRSFLAGTLRRNGETIPVMAGQTLQHIPEIELLVLTTRDERPVYLRDVASVVIAPEQEESRVWHMERRGDAFSSIPAVSLALAKREGANAVDVADEILEKVEALEGRLIPNSIDVHVTRNYGETANEKANELLFHLGLATLSIVILVALALGWRESFVTFVVIPITILLTLYASYIMGYTINRVSLFALIFSIGILVDDAIVMIENISRHWAMEDNRSRIEAAIQAVGEVGNPTIVATLTVIVALLPLLFVTGLIGPYMAPIPVNASAAMLFSFFIAVMVAPWLLVKITPERKTVYDDDADRHKDHGAKHGGLLGSVFRKFARPVLRTRLRAFIFLLSVGSVTLLSMTLFYTKDVTVKLLPFDNKSELQIVVDLQEGASLEDTERVLLKAAQSLAPIDQIHSIQAYAGTAAPFNFNGLVRHYYLRNSPELGDLQINLIPKEERDLPSHEVALLIREQLKDLSLPEGAVIKVVEVPPGPPVLATLLAEIYGPSDMVRRQVSDEIKAIFHSVPYIVDIDDSKGEQEVRLRLSIDQDNLEFFGVEQKDVYDTLDVLFSGVSVGYSHRGEGRNPLEITIAMPKRDLRWSQALASTPVPANALPGSRDIVELGDVVSHREELSSHTVFRRNGHTIEMVSAELAGEFEAPIYGMLAVNDLIESHDWGDLPKPEIAFHGQPTDESYPTLLWDGEWEVTYATFRDLGIAFAAAMLGIYILVVAQFKSFKLPLVILTPVPLTFIGIIFGHWLFDAAFSAPSMVGFIALAGIIVRNSILLVDFISMRRENGASLRETLLEAGSIRFKPILLTALAAMLGASVILTDPIFQGLALSLFFGLISSTLLTVLVIPAIYVLLRDDGKPFAEDNSKRNA